MRKILFFLFVNFAGLFLFAQQLTILNFDTHVLKEETINEMKLCNYSEPGPSGLNITWDFSNLKVTKEFSGNILSMYHSINSNIFPDAKIELDEFGNKFYFNISENKIEQVGYLSKDNLVIMEYDKPLLKMIYPFTYGDNYKGELSGLYKLKNNVVGNFEGTYEIVGDGAGTLILPDNFLAKNVLRVKTTYEYDLTVNNSKQKNKVTTYRWYCQNHRYPLLVFIKSETMVNSQIYYNYQAAFNNDVLPETKSTGSKFNEIAEDNVKIFPNPASNKMNIQMNLSEIQKVLIDLYDINGKKITSLENKEFPAGIFDETYFLNSNLQLNGTYILKIKTNEIELNKEILITR